jgi:hypothetical protein
MNDVASANPARRTSNSAALAGTFLLVAATSLALWSWSRVCLFPENAWNDVRLAPTIALSRGLPVYPTAHQGVISTWTYGPLPLLFFWPASWSSTAAGAMEIAAMLNFLVVVVPMAIVCWRWPSVVGRGTTWARTAAFLFCLALWPQRSFDYHQSDNLAMACALLGNLVLIRSTRTAHYWIAAALAVASVGCKQIAIGVPLAQLAWLAIVQGPRSAMHHAWRMIAVGLVLALLVVPVFGAVGLWFVLVQMPARFPWGQGIGAWLVELAAQLGWQLGLPALVMAWFWRSFGRPALLLPAIAWASALPIGITALLKQGGDLNSLHCALLWLPPVATVAACSLASHDSARLSWVASAVVVLLAVNRTTSQSRLALRPQLDAYRTAETIARAYPNQVWFPWNPLVSLYGDGRYYHDEDGLHVRFACRYPITAQLFRAHLPPKIGAIAIRSNRMDWGVARQVLPLHAENRQIGQWTLWLAKEDADLSPDHAAADVKH